MLEMIVSQIWRMKFQNLLIIEMRPFNGIVCLEPNRIKLLYCQAEDLRKKLLYTWGIATSCGISVRLCFQDCFNSFDRLNPHMRANIAPMILGLVSQTSMESIDGGRMQIWGNEYFDCT